MKNIVSQKKYIFLIFSIVILFSFIACSNNTNETSYEIIVFDDSKDSSGKLVIDDCFTVCIPIELAYIQNESTKIELIDNNGVSIGSIEKYPYQESSLPSLIDPNIDYFQFINILGIQVDPNNLTAYTFSTGVYDGWEIWLHSETMDITHNLFPCSGYLYNIWFNNEMITVEVTSQILNSMQFIEE